MLNWSRKTISILYTKRMDRPVLFHLTFFSTVLPKESMQDLMGQWLKFTRKSLKKMSFIPHAPARKWLWNLLHRFQTPTPSSQSFPVIRFLALQDQCWKAMPYMEGRKSKCNPVQDACLGQWSLTYTLHSFETMCCLRKGGWWQIQTAHQDCRSNFTQISSSAFPSGK